MSIVGAMIAGAVISALAAGVDTAVNAAQAQKNRDFQKEIAQNNIKYTVQQAQDLGISPSLVLGDATHSLGGSGGNVSNSAGAMSNAVNGALKYELEKEKLKTAEEMNEDRMQALKDIANTKIDAQKDMYAMKNNHSARVTNKQYTKEELGKFFTDLSKYDI